MKNEAKLHKRNASSGTFVYDNKGNFVVKCPTEKEADEYIENYEKEGNSQVEE